MSPSPSPYQPDPAIQNLIDLIADPVQATHFPQHILRFRNARWDQAVGLGGLDDQQWLAHFGAFTPLPDNLREPLALRYHGHQFRSYNPDLGDGRGFLFAQLRDGRAACLTLAAKVRARPPIAGPVMVG
jgi:serine/tyrosine/threonine adenylyltransferase